MSVTGMAVGPIVRSHSVRTSPLWCADPGGALICDILLRNELVILIQVCNNIDGITLTVYNRGMSRGL